MISCFNGASSSMMVLTSAKTTPAHIMILRENSPKLGKILDLVLVFRLRDNDIILAFSNAFQ